MLCDPINGVESVADADFLLDEIRIYGTKHVLNHAADYDMTPRDMLRFIQRNIDYITRHHPERGKGE